MRVTTPIVLYQQRGTIGAGPYPASTGQSPARSRGLVRFQAACQLGRFGEHEIPALFSTTRRRAAAESGHIRLFPVTRGLTPSQRV